MRDKKKQSGQKLDRGGKQSGGRRVAGEPGRTASKAEGDLDTVEESLRQKERKGKS
jgi:hypothetical protein